MFKVPDYMSIKRHFKICLIQKTTLTVAAIRSELQSKVNFMLTTVVTLRGRIAF